MLLLSDISILYVMMVVMIMMVLMMTLVHGILDIDDCSMTMKHSEYRGTVIFFQVPFYFLAIGVLLLSMIFNACQQQLHSCSDYDIIE